MSASGEEMAIDEDLHNTTQKDDPPVTTEYDEIVQRLRAYIVEHVIQPLGYRRGGAAVMQAIGPVMAAPGVTVTAPDTPREAAVLFAARAAKGDEIWGKESNERPREEAQSKGSVNPFVDIAKRDHTGPPTPKKRTHVGEVGLGTPPKKVDRGHGLTAYSDTSEDER